MEHSSWNNWPLNAQVLVDGDEKDLAEQCETIIDDEEFLRDILLQQPSTVSSESDESRCLVHKSGRNSLSSNDLEGSVSSGKRIRPRTFILSFDKSTIIPATQETEVATTSSKSKKRNLELKPMASNQGGKKTRSDSQVVDHIMAERKRRQELSQKFIALSATIPGLKKTDKTSILREAINYVKVLQERVRELEERNKKGKESTIILNKNKTDLCGNKDTTSSETNSEDCSELLPVVKAKMLESEVLIEIHCEKANGIELKILDLLENLHLFVTGSSVLPFGNSTFGITIITQMGEAYRMAVNDLVETLRRMLINQATRNTYPY